MATPVLRPRCWSGKNSTLSPRASAHSSTRPGVGRRAHGAAVAADERLQRGGAVHVGDRHDALDVDDLGEGLPGGLDLVDVGHVGHRAAGVEVGEDDGLVVAGEDVGRLGHEVHAAEDDDVGLGAALGQHGEPVRVAAGIGPADDLVALVVVPEDEQPVAERRLGVSDPAGQVVRGRGGVALRERGLEPQHRCQDLRRGRTPVCGRWGQPGRLTHGDVVPGVDMQPVFRAGFAETLRPGDPLSRLQPETRL